MIDYKKMKVDGKTPVYIQIVEYLKQQIYLGNVENGDALPSRRELGVVLGINPNTAQKAFKLMEEEQLIETPPNAASRVMVDRKTRKKIEQEFTKEFICNFIDQAKAIELSKEELIQNIEKYWN